MPKEGSTSLAHKVYGEQKQQRIETPGAWVLLLSQLCSHSHDDAGGRQTEPSIDPTSLTRRKRTRCYRGRHSAGRHRSGAAPRAQERPTARHVHAAETQHLRRRRGITTCTTALPLLLLRGSSSEAPPWRLLLLLLRCCYCPPCRCARRPRGSAAVADAGGGGAARRDTRLSESSGRLGHWTVGRVSGPR